MSSPTRQTPESTPETLCRMPKEKTAVPWGQAILNGLFTGAVGAAAGHVLGKIGSDEHAHNRFGRYMLTIGMALVGMAIAMYSTIKNKLSDEQAAATFKENDALKKTASTLREENSELREEAETKPAQPHHHVHDAVLEKSMEAAAQSQARGA